MYEIDFLPVGDGERSGDAIAMRFNDPSTGQLVVGVVDAGFADDGEALVDHIERYYGTSSVDFVLSTHPDADHISGMGVVMRNLDVGTLLIHRPAEHGFPDNSGAKPAEELVELALSQGAQVVEPFAGVHGFGDALLIAGPTPELYVEMLEAQEVTSKAASSDSFAARFGATVLAEARQLLDAFPGELLFDDAGGTNPRNNSAAVLSILLSQDHLLFPSDTGVLGLNEAMDYLESHSRTEAYPSLFALPHHGSRHNLDRQMIQRILGPPTSNRRGSAIASVSGSTAKYPSPRIANAAGRRGYPVFATAGKGILHHSPDAPPRDGWTSCTPLPPLAETDHDE